MEKVTGIGGVFFKANNPAHLAAWYREHLGVPVEDGHADFHWREADFPDRVGRTVWSLFPSDTDYFGPSSPSFMINYRVANLDRMLEQLRRGGVVVEKVQEYDYGRSPGSRTRKAIGSSCGSRRPLEHDQLRAISRAEKPPTEQTAIKIRSHRCGTEARLR